MMEKPKWGLTKTQLKLLAAGTMAIDHIGAYLLPQYLLLRIIGRLAFPIYAFYIYEGAVYTRHKARYLGRVAALGAVCMGGYYLYTGQVYGNILITFSFSLMLLFAIQGAQASRDGPKGAFLLWAAGAVGVVLAAQLACQWMGVDYGMAGVLLPAWPMLADRDKRESRPRALAYFGVGLVIVALTQHWVQWFGLAALPLLALEKPGPQSPKMKYFFYIFYPTHFVVIAIIAQLMGL